MLIILRVVDLFLNLMDTHREHILAYAFMCVCAYELVLIPDDF